ncbi:MAG: molybdenum cofactor biosynthesis protein MoaE [Bacteroidota bacterium]
MDSTVQLKHVPHIAIHDSPLDVQAILDQVYSDKCGAVNVFIGTVRNSTKGKQVVRLDFEAYKSMAIKEMNKIALRAIDQWPVEHIAIVHRTGTLAIGEIAVVIAVSTPHRAASFAACQFAIDTLKETVPIWKKEIFEDGEVWVAAHP